MFVCLSLSMFRMAGQTAGPIETKLDTSTHVHPGSVSVKVIHVCVRVSVRHRHVFTHILLENVGGSEQNRSVIAK